VQMVEIYFNVQSDNGSITDGHALRQWSQKYRRALDDLKDLRIGSRLGNLLTAAGLVEVDTNMIQLPLSAWPTGEFIHAEIDKWHTQHRSDLGTDNRTRQIGAANRNNVQRFLSSMALYPFTQRLHMSGADFDDLISRARYEADDRSLKAYFPV
jgi:hypothetical protein